MAKKQYRVGDIYKWQGIKNDETGNMTMGYLFFVTELDKDGDVVKANSVTIHGVKNKSEAIKKYNEEVVCEYCGGSGKVIGHSWDEDAGMYAPVELEDCECQKN